MHIDLTRFKDLLLRTCGHSFENEREQALSAAVCRRMMACSVDDHDAYFFMLLTDAEELLRLTELLTVNETYFFREPGHLNLIVNKLLPQLVDARQRRPVRILSAGCSTGEEPYSIAILLRERFGAESGRLFSIMGVDIDSTVIAGAREGIYGNASFRGIDRRLFERYFEPCGSGKFRVEQGIRKLVEFEVVNLLGTSYPQRMLSPDLILYRNVSIYFPGQVQREIFARLAELLAEGGSLMVGAAETMHHDIGILSLVKLDSLFYYHNPPVLVFEERRKSSRTLSVPERGGYQPKSPPHAAGTGVVPLLKQAGHSENHRKRSHVAVEADVRKRFDEAIELARSNQHEKALTVLDAIIELDGSFGKAHCLKGSLLLNAMRFNDACKVSEAILERDPLCLEAYLMLGMIARQNGDDEGAFRRFRDAI